MDEDESESISPFGVWLDRFLALSFLEDSPTEKAYGIVRNSLDSSRRYCGMGSAAHACADLVAISSTQKESTKRNVQILPKLR